MDNYTTIEEIGKGAFSIVLKVEHKETKQIYAIKQVNLKGMERKEVENSVNEVRILASIDSNHVISYKEAFYLEKNDTLNIVMEYCNDSDLDNKIEKAKKKKAYFQEQEIWNTLYQIVLGLKALHDKRIIHRDIKSANVFMTKDGIIKLGDLNVSKLIKNEMLKTQTGTPYYASPEVWRDKPYDFKSDIWSLGCVLYEMTTFNPPFKGNSMEQVFDKICRCNYPAIPRFYSKELSNMIANLLKVNPLHRPNVDTLINLLGNLIKKKHFKCDFAVIDKSNDDELNDSSLFISTIRIPLKFSEINRLLPKTGFKRNKILNSENNEPLLDVTEVNSKRCYKSAFTRLNNNNNDQKYNNADIKTNNKVLENNINKYFEENIIESDLNKLENKNISSLNNIDNIIRNKSRNETNNYSENKLNSNILSRNTNNEMNAKNNNLLIFKQSLNQQNRDISNNNNILNSKSKIYSSYQQEIVNSNANKIKNYHFSEENNNNEKEEYKSININNYYNYHIRPKLVHPIINYGNYVENPLSNQYQPVKQQQPRKIYNLNNNTDINANNDNNILSNIRIKRMLRPQQIIPKQSISNQDVNNLNSNSKIYPENNKYFNEEKNLDYLIRKEFDNNNNNFDFIHTIEDNTKNYYDNHIINDQNLNYISDLINSNNALNTDLNKKYNYPISSNTNAYSRNNNSKKLTPLLTEKITNLNRHNRNLNSNSPTKYPHYKTYNKEENLISNLNIISNKNNNNIINIGNTLQPLVTESINNNLKSNSKLNSYINNDIYNNRNITAINNQDALKRNILFSKNSHINNPHYKLINNKQLISPNNSKINLLISNTDVANINSQYSNIQNTRNKYYGNNNNYQASKDISNIRNKKFKLDLSKKGPSDSNILSNKYNFPLYQQQSLCNNNYPSNYPSIYLNSNNLNNTILNHKHDKENNNKTNIIPLFDFKNIRKNKENCTNPNDIYTKINNTNFYNNIVNSNRVNSSNIPIHNELYNEERVQFTKEDSYLNNDANADFKKIASNYIYKTNSRNVNKNPVVVNQFLSMKLNSRNNNNNMINNYAKNNNITTYKDDVYKTNPYNHFYI